MGEKTVDENMWHTETMECSAAERKKALLPFVTTWMELENIMLSEINQMGKDKHYMISPVRGIQ